jgi:hypothetical protein
MEEKSIGKLKCPAAWTRESTAEEIWRRAVAPGTGLDGSKLVFSFPASFPGKDDASRSAQIGRPAVSRLHTYC